MAIEQAASGAIIITGEADVALYQLAAVRAALRMEKVGMKTRGGSIRKGWAVRLGLKPGATYDAVIAEITRRLNARAPA